MREPPSPSDVFLVFYAIFWGAVFIVQSPWKAFHWPLYDFRPARCRTALSFLILNVVPIIFFAFAMGALTEPISTKTSPCLEYTRAAFAALAIFGIYRVWLGVIELSPSTFYAPTVADIPVKYQHVEPTFRPRFWCDSMGRPTVKLGRYTGYRNVAIGFIYLSVAVFVLLLPYELTTLCQLTALFAVRITSLSQ